MTDTFSQFGKIAKVLGDIYAPEWWKEFTVYTIFDFLSWLDLK